MLKINEEVINAIKIEGSVDREKYNDEVIEGSKIDEVSASKMVRMILGFVITVLGSAIALHMLGSDLMFFGILIMIVGGAITVAGGLDLY